ncbi:hypothetical protein C0J52_07175 [Blattella germanica]|nr:hypothetical protein C0J52_07175 [Blattella germanica]
MGANPSPRWSALRGSAELRAYSSLPRHQDCSYPILSEPRHHSSPPPDPDNNENLPPLTNSLISPPPSSLSTQQKQESGDDDSGEKSGLPSFHPGEQQLPPHFRDRVHTSPVPMMTRQRRYSPSRDSVDRGILNQEVFVAGERLQLSGRARGFLNRTAKSESDHDYRSHISSVPIMDRGIHDGYSSSPTSRRRELLKHPKFSDLSQERSPDLIPRSKHYSDFRQSFSDDSSPTPVRSNLFGQPEVKHKSVIEENILPGSLKSEEQKRKFLVAKDERKSSANAKDQKLEQRDSSHPGLESLKSISSTASVIRDSNVATKPRRHPLIRSSEVHSSILGHDPHPLTASTELYHGLEYSGNSDSGGEIMATPPMPSRRFGCMTSTSKRGDEGPLEESPGPGGSSPASMRASSGDDIMDAEPLFRKVTIKKRRQETRRLLDGNGEF